MHTRHISNFYVNPDSHKNPPNQLLRPTHKRSESSFQPGPPLHQNSGNIFLQKAFPHGHGGHAPMKREMSLAQRNNQNGFDGPALKLPKAPAWDLVYHPESFSAIRSPTQGSDMSLSSSLIKPQLQNKSFMTPGVYANANPTPKAMNFFSPEKSLLESRLESQLDKQNKILSQLTNAITVQEKREKDRYKQVMSEKMKELEAESQRMNFKLEKQQLIRYQKLSESPSVRKPVEEESTPKKGSSSYLQEILVSMMMKKSNSKKNLTPMNRNDNSSRSFHPPEEEYEEDKEENSFNPKKIKSRLRLRSDEDFAQMQMQPQKSASIFSPQQRESLGVEMFGTSSGIGGGGKEISMQSWFGNNNSDHQSASNQLNDDNKRRGGVFNMGLNLDESGKNLGGPIIDMKKKKTQQKLGAFTWGLVYTTVLYNTTKRNMLNARQEYEANISSKMAQIFDVIRF